jgi:hypothetical protein
LEWLANSYIKKNGLRAWNWRKIINGIIKEHKRVTVRDNQEDQISEQHVELIWHTFLKVNGIENLSIVPNTSDPDHPDVKAIIFMYSMESFLF